MSTEERPKKESDQEASGTKLTGGLITESELEELTKTATPETVDAWKRFPAAVGINRVVSTIENAFNYVALALVMVLMLFITFGVLSRFILNLPFKGSVDVPEMVAVVLVFMALAYTERIGGHIRMEAVVIGAFKGRTQHLTEAVTRFLSLIIFALITIWGFKNAVNALTVGDVTPAIYFPTWPARMSVVIGGFLLCIRFIIEILQHVTQAVVEARR